MFKIDNLPKGKAILLQDGVMYVSLDSGKYRSDPSDEYDIVVGANSHDAGVILPVVPRLYKQGQGRTVVFYKDAKSNLVLSAVEYKNKLHDIENKWNLDSTITEIDREYFIKKEQALLNERFHCIAEQMYDDDTVIEITIVGEMTPTDSPFILNHATRGRWKQDGVFEVLVTKYVKHCVSEAANRHQLSYDVSSDRRSMLKVESKYFNDVWLMDMPLFFHTLTDAKNQLPKIKAGVDNWIWTIAEGNNAVPSVSSWFKLSELSAAVVSYISDIDAKAKSENDKRYASNKAKELLQIIQSEIEKARTEQKTHSDVDPTFV